MGDQVIRIALILCVCLAAGPVHAARAVVDQLVVDDSDGMWQYRLLAGLDQTIDRPLAGGSAGIRIGRWRIDDNEGREDFDMLSLRYDSGDQRAWRTKAGLSQLSGEGSPTLGDVIVDWNGGRWQIEGSAQRELVDTVTAIRLHYLIDTWSLSAEYRFNPRWTAVGAVYTQSVTDGNARSGQVGRLIYSPERLEGFTLEGYLRHVDSDFNGIGYFSPGHLRETLLIAGYRRSVLGEHWIAGARLGAGRREIDRDIDNTLYLAELSLRGWFTDRFGLDGKVACSSAGGSAISQGESGYRYCTANLSLIGAWY
jgi:hypothetical protein